MAEVEKSIQIKAPIHLVFNMIANQPERTSDWWKALRKHERLTQPPTAVGSRTAYEYNMMGILIHGEHEVVNLVENERITVRTLSGVRADLTFQMQPIRGGTELTLTVTYNLPVGPMDDAVNRLAIEEKNLFDIQDALRNLKRLLE